MNNISPMKRILPYILIFFIGNIWGIWGVYALLPSSIIWAPEVVCPEDNANDFIYVPTGSNTVSTVFGDFFRSNPGTLSLIREEISQVRVYQGPANNLSNACLNFQLTSNVSNPAWGWVLAVANPALCQITRTPGITPNTLVWQLVFNIGYRESQGILRPFQAGDVPYQYTPGVPPNVFLPSVVLPDQSRQQWWWVQSHGNECRNLYLRWCWDGIVSAADGEACDLGAQNGVAGSACSATCQAVVPPPVVPPGGGGGGGGGGGWLCSNLSGMIVSNVGGVLTETFTCSAIAGLAWVQTNYTINCGNNAQVFNGSNALGSFQATCTYQVANINAQTNATCSINNTNPGTCQMNPLNGSIGWGGGGGGGNNGGSWLCGNGVLDIGEDCDTGNLGGGINHAVCTNCHLASTNPGGCTPGIPDPGCPIGFTNPGAYGINILLNGLPVSDYRAIIGHNVSVFENDNFTLNTTFPIRVEWLTTGIVNNAGTHIAGNNVFSTLHGCVGPGIMVTNALTQSTTPCTQNMPLFASNNGNIQGQVFRGDTTGVSTIADANPPTSPGSAVLSNNFFIGVNYYAEPIPVRVSNSVISSIAGGNAMINEVLWVPVNGVVENFIEQLKNGNFIVASNKIEYSSVWALGGTDGNSSQIQSIDTFIAPNTASTAPMNTLIASADQLNNNPLFNYGSNGSVVILPKGNLTFDGVIELSGVKTIVVEDGDLILSKNITYLDSNASVAFIVKHGNIIVDSSVTKLSGVYLVLSGEIRGNGSTTNQLIVDGNMYGNLSKLVNDRTYVRGVNTSTALTTGVTISYSTRALKNPPPLLTQFLDQYELSRVVQ